MISVAKSLRPHPERDLIDREEKALEQAEREAACPFSIAWNALDHLATAKGEDAARNHAKAWVRRHGAPKAKRPKTGRVVRFARAEALFRGRG